MFSDEGRHSEPELEQPSSSDPLSIPFLAVTDVHSPGVPAVPHPGRTIGRSAAILLPKWVYIKDMDGLYLSVRSSPTNRTLTFRSGEPDLSCAFGATVANWNSSSYKFLGSNGNNIMRWTNEFSRWYSCDVIASFPHFQVITSTGNFVYLKDNMIPTGFKSSVLNANGAPLARDFINESSRFEILQAAVKNEITDVKYDIPGGKVLEAAPLIALSTSVRNDSNGDVNQTLTYSFEKWSVGTWNNAAGTEIGSKATFTAGVPFISSAEFEISVSASYSHEWGGEEGQRQTITSSTTVTVPPKKRARATVIVRNAQIDVGFTYTQSILWSNGQSEQTARTGIYNNVDSWHVDVVLDNWEDV
jgi:hypothetical protein